MKAAQAALAQAQANLDHQQADTSRTVALAKQGIMSAAGAATKQRPACRPPRPRWMRRARIVAAAAGHSAPGAAHELLTQVAARTVD